MINLKKKDHPFNHLAPLNQPEVIPQIDPEEPEEPEVPEEDPDENPFIRPPVEVPPFIESHHLN